MGAFHLQGDRQLLQLPYLEGVGLLIVSLRERVIIHDSGRDGTEKKRGFLGGWPAVTHRGLKPKRSLVGIPMLVLFHL